MGTFYFLMFISGFTTICTSVEINSFFITLALFTLPIYSVTWMISF
jgi:hypothetical protein